MRSGLWDAVEGRVMIYLHKEQMLEAVERRYPAKHYVMVDDKLRILDAMKKSWGSGSPRFSSARDTTHSTWPTSRPIPPPNLTIERIGDLAGLTVANLSEAP